MTQTLQHSYQLRKTQFLAQKQNIELDNISLQLIQSTCLSANVMNRNNVLQGNNLIYLNGSFITFYNFFQNSKQFASSVTTYKAVGMAGNNAGRGNIAVVSQNEDKTQLQISIYTNTQPYVPTHIIKKQLQFIDIIMIKSTYIVLCAYDIKNKEYIVYIFNSKTVLPLQFIQPIKRLICIDHHIYTIFTNGGMFEIDVQKSVSKQDIIPEYKDKLIQDYCEIQNQIKVILLQGNIVYCYWYETQKQIVFDFNKHVEPNSKTHRMVKVGRNILIAHRNSLTMTHISIGEQNVVFICNHAYQQKLKAGIISVQSSPDEMHAALAVQITERQEIKIQNFIFNLSSISKSYKFMSPYTRVMPMGADCGAFGSLENVLSSNLFMLIGSKIFNLYCSTTLQRKKMYNLYEVPKFMTVHPLSYQFLCGFDNIIKFYNKVQKQLQQVWSQQYICTAAKYSKSGSLVLSCIQDSFTTLVIYDPYNFRRIKNIPIFYLKFFTTKIQWVHNNNVILLFSNVNNQLLKINVMTGERLAQFRENRQKQKKDGYNVKCIDYDTYYDRAFLGTNANLLIIASKTETNGHSLCPNKLINFLEEISCIKINHGLRTIFIGSKTGTFYWTSYPMKLRNANLQQPAGTFSIAQQLNHIKLHNFPITSIDHTNNNKFMLINIKNHGYFKCRIRKLRNKDANNNINMNVVFQELGNLVLNTIDTSSAVNYAINKQKLKITLEKRKQCFNDLQQFRRQWELRSVMNSKKIDMSSKKDELTFITQTLAKIQDIKEKKKNIKISIEKIQTQIQQVKTEKQQNYYKEMLQLYQENDKQNQILSNKKKQYNIEYQKFYKQCSQNLLQIEKDLKEKRQLFESNYSGMLKNLQNFKKRYIMEQNQEKEQYKLEIQEYLNQLQKKQLQLNALSNDLSIKITQSKKQYERYSNRLGFMDHKKVFFVQQHQNSNQQKIKLLQFKDKLQIQLKQLQVYTDKKQKKLRAYLKANQALQKYKSIHQNLAQNAERETLLIKKQEQKLDENIVEIQKELSTVASANQQMDKQIQTLQKQLDVKKKNNFKLNLKMKDIGYYLNQILAAMENIGYCSTEAQRSQKLKSIYQYFYVERNVENIIEKHNKKQQNFQQNFIADRNEKMKAQQLKILSQISDQKQYIQNNIQMFNDYNNRIKQEINLNYLQIQAKNYNLIAECNLRKQQTLNKKRMLHELIDSVKETQIYLDQMKRQKSGQQDKKGRKKSRPLIKTKNEVPFLLYQKSKQQNRYNQFVHQKSEQQSLTGSRSITHAFSHSNFRPTTTHILTGKSNFAIKKILDIKGLFNENQQQKQKLSVRRIKTATNKKKGAVEFCELVDFNQNMTENKGIMKPMTATLKTRKLRQTLKSAFSIKNKSSSKPSTCATFTRSKPSLAI